MRSQLAVELVPLDRTPSKGTRPVDLAHPRERRRVRQTRYLGSALEDLLLTGPSPDETARLLVSLLGATIGASGAALLTRHEGEVHCLGSHLPEGLSWCTTSHVPDPDDLPAVVRDAWDGHPGTAPCPVSPEPMSFTAWPLVAPSLVVAVAILITPTAADAARVRSCMADVAGGLALYLSGLTRRESATPVTPTTSGTSDRPRGDAGPDALTPRQQDILRLLASGMTMRQIAGRIGFSDSTVRAESLRIYRTLGVHTRAEAVAALDLPLRES